MGVVRIYLHPDQWGAGHGRALLDRVLAAIPGDVVDVSLWVNAENRRARQFYECHGFAADGHERLHTIGGREVSEVRYLRAR